jgi:3-phosphoglycerate kinase
VAREGVRVRMPNLGIMARQGVIGEQALPPSPGSSYASHASIVTGLLPSRSGIVADTQLDENGTKVEPYWNSQMIKGTALWDAAIGRGVMALGWPTTIDARIELVLPEDVVVADAIEDPQQIAVVAHDAIPSDLMVVDIGPVARSRYSQTLAGARTVFWNGPMGVFEVAEYAAGTLAVAEGLAASAAFSVVGGGESVMAIRQAGVIDSIDHVSTGGGASLKFITGETMPAIAALES